MNFNLTNLITIENHLGRSRRFFGTDKWAGAARSSAFSDDQSIRLSDFMRILFSSTTACKSRGSRSLSRWCSAGWSGSELVSNSQKQLLFFKENLHVDRLAYSRVHIFNSILVKIITKGCFVDQESGLVRSLGKLLRWPTIPRITYFNLGLVLYHNGKGLRAVVNMNWLEVDNSYFF